MVLARVWHLIWFMRWSRDESFRRPPLAVLVLVAQRLALHVGSGRVTAWRKPYLPVLLIFKMR